MPQFPGCVDERLEEQSDKPDPGARLQLVEVDHGRASQLEQPTREELGGAWLGRAVPTLPTQHVVELLAEGVELAIWIDDGNRARE